MSSVRKTNSKKIVTQGTVVNQKGFGEFRYFLFTEEGSKYLLITQDAKYNQLHQYLFDMVSIKGILDEDQQTLYIVKVRRIRSDSRDDLEDFEEQDSSGYASFVEDEIFRSGYLREEF